ncbi:hypothetical protein Tco_0091309 [Tanacetum coccineum]
MTIKTEKNGASGSVVVDEKRGRDDARQHPKKRGTSKDVVASLDKRVAGVDTSMSELDFTSMREDFRVSLNTLSGDLMREIHGVRDMFMDEITKIRTEFGEEISTLHQTFEDLQADSGPWLVEATPLIMDQSWMFLNHHRSWESGRPWRLIRLFIIHNIIL